MTAKDHHDITGMLAAWKNGSTEALDRVIDIIYKCSRWMRHSKTLARIDARKSRVAELRYFGGLSSEETAEALRVSLDTAKRDWRIARAWLLTELSRKQESRGS